MPITMRGNWLFAVPGEPAYKVASNFTNYLELGRPDVTSYHLLARIDGGEFLVNAVLVNPTTGAQCKVIDNFPTGPTDFERRMTPGGYHILDSDGALVLGIDMLEPKICLLRGTIYDADGSVVAQDQGDDFLVHRGPAILGKANGAIGMMIE